MGGGWTLYVWADLGDNRGAESHIGHEMAVHDVDLGRVSDMAANGCSRVQEGRTCSQSAPWCIVSTHALPSSAKSADRIEGAMMAGGDMMAAL
jgi:hypothetical protein